MGPFSRAIILVVAALTAAGAGARAEAAARPGEGANYFRIGTGSIAGTYFPVGEALAAILSQPAGAPPCDEGGRCGVPGLIATAQATEGSLANIAAVNSGNWRRVSPRPRSSTRPIGARACSTASPRPPICG